MTETEEWLRERIRYSDEYESVEVLVKDLASIADEIERLRFLLHEARGAIFCWNPVSEAGNKMQEEILNAIDAELEEKE